MRDMPMGMVYWRCMSIKVFNYSGRDTSFGSDNMIFVGENWLNKIDRIPKDRSRLPTDFYRPCRISPTFGSAGSSSLGA